MDLIAAYAGLASLVVALVFWCIAVTNMLRMVANKKDDAPEYLTWQTAHIALLHPEYLSDAGLAARRKFITAGIVVCVCTAIGFAIIAVFDV